MRQTCKTPLSHLCLALGQLVKLVKLESALSFLDYEPKTCFYITSFGSFATVAYLFSINCLEFNFSKRLETHKLLLNFVKL